MINWRWRSFDQLTTLELFQALKLRAEVFIFEQRDIYTDPDDEDLRSWHLLGYSENNQLIAYGRVIPPHANQECLKLGRIVVDQAFRGLQLGQQLLTEMLAWIKLSDYRHLTIEIGAQLYLKDFYQKFAFYTVGTSFLMGAIPHIIMQRQSAE